MTIKLTLEDYRVESILSESIRIIKIYSTEPLVSFSGYIVPLRIAMVLLIWTKLNQTPYKRYVCDDDLTLIQTLNPKIELFNDKNAIFDVLYYKMQKLGAKWVDNNIDALLDTTIDA